MQRNMVKLISAVVKSCISNTRKVCRSIEVPQTVPSNFYLVSFIFGADFYLLSVGFATGRRFELLRDEGQHCSTTTAPTAYPGRPTGQNKPRYSQTRGSFTSLILLPAMSSRYHTPSYLLVSYSRRRPPTSPLTEWKEEGQGEEEAKRSSRCIPASISFRIYGLFCTLFIFYSVVGEMIV